MTIVSGRLYIPRRGTINGQVLTLRNFENGEVEWGEGGSGEEWFSGTGAPATGIGEDGDWYLDTATPSPSLFPPPYVTSLPSSPADGQEVYYGHAQGIWHLRFRAGAAGAYKWQFIGGVPLYSQSAIVWGPVTSAAWSIVTLTPLTAPLAGDYRVRFSNYMTGSVATALIFVNFSIGGVNPVDDTKSQMLQPPGANYACAGHGVMVADWPGVAAGSAFQMVAKVNSGSMTNHNRWVELAPLRVG